MQLSAVCLKWSCSRLCVCVCPCAWVGEYQEHKRGKVSFNSPVAPQLEHTLRRESYIKETRAALNTIWTMLCSFELYLLKKGKRKERKKKRKPAQHKVPTNIAREEIFWFLGDQMFLSSNIAARLSPLVLFDTGIHFSFLKVAKRACYSPNLGGRKVCKNKPRVF